MIDNVDRALASGFSDIPLFALFLVFPAPRA